MRLPTYRALLVPLDGSDFSEHALPYAAEVARRTGARIELAHVHELPADAYWPAPAPRREEERRAREREYLRRTAAAVESAAGVPVSERLLAGRPAAALAARVEEAGIGLIVMGTHGRTGPARAWLGSVADELVRSVEVPLLLVRPGVEPVGAGEAAELDEAVVALDGSAAAERILPHAAALGRPGRARFTLVRVVPPALVVGGHVFRLDEERVREVSARSAAYLARVAAALREHAAEVGTRVVVEESPAAAILEVAAAIGAGLIAMTTHGYGGFRRLLLGSVADKVLRAATVPVLLYRPGE